jgi:hypothetical protein
MAGCVIFGLQYAPASHAAALGPGAIAAWIALIGFVAYRIEVDFEAACRHRDHHRRRRPHPGRIVSGPVAREGDRRRHDVPRGLGARRDLPRLHPAAPARSDSRRRACLRRRPRWSSVRGITSSRRARSRARR